MAPQAGRRVGTGERFFGEGLLHSRVDAWYGRSRVRPPRWHV